MANRTRFAGMYNAVDYAYGCASSGLPPALVVDIGAAAVGAGTLQLVSGVIALTDGTFFAPLNINAPINVGSTTGQESVTPTAVGNATSSRYDATTVTATFANLHGQGDPISSATFGLQEAVNDAFARGGGVVIVNAGWRTIGGTNAIIAAIVPQAGVIIQDTSGALAMPFWATRPTGAALSVPAIATTATVASQPAIVGTWTASTIHVRFTYVTASGGETLGGTDYTFTSTVSVAIGGTGPAAATGAVGYRVYMGTTAWLVPVIAANGTVIQCGAIAAFKIGTPFSVAAITTTASTVPLVASAFITSVVPSLTSPPPFQNINLPFADVGSISAASAKPLGDVQLPTGYLNFVGRTLRISGTAVITTNAATGTLTIQLILYSVYSTTSTVVFTVACPSTAMGAAVVNCEFNILLTTLTTGATGTLEVHGTVDFNLAGTAVGTLAMDFVAAASSAVNLTAQLTAEISITTATVVPTAGVLRQLVVETIA